MCPGRIWFRSDSYSKQKMNSTSGSRALICLILSWPTELRARAAALGKWRISRGGGGRKKIPSEATVEGLLLINASHYTSSVSRAAGRPISSAVWDVSCSNADNWPWTQAGVRFHWVCCCSQTRSCQSHWRQTLFFFFFQFHLNNNEVTLFPLKNQVSPAAAVFKKADEI